MKASRLALWTELESRGLGEPFSILYATRPCKCMLIRFVANGLNSGGFCAGSRHGIVVDHQRINGTSFVFSIAVPTLLSVSTSFGINILRYMPSIQSPLQENIRVIHAVLDSIDSLTIPSHAASAIIHLYLHTAMPSLSVGAAKAPNPATAASRDAPSFEIAGEEHLLQDIVDEVLAKGV